MPNVSSFGAQTDNAVVSGTVTDRQMVIPEVPPQGLMSVGPRVTPNFIKEPWSKANSYNFFDVVKDSAGASYIAIKPVIPANTELTNEEFWFKWSDPDAQLNELDKIVKLYDQRIAKNTNDILTKAPINHASDETSYGIGNEINYGHVKLATDDTPMTSGANDGVAATPEMVGDVIEVSKKAFIVTDYGVDNTGASDCSDALQACINASATGVYFPAGVYKISKPIDFPYNTVEPYGISLADGANIVTTNAMKYMFGVGTIDKNVGTATEGFSITGGVFNGGNAARTAIYFSKNVTQSRISNVDARNCVAEHIYIDCGTEASTDTIVSNVRIGRVRSPAENSAAIGIYFAGNDNIVSTAYITDCLIGVKASGLLQVDNVHIFNNKFWNSYNTVGLQSQKGPVIGTNVYIDTVKIAIKSGSFVQMDGMFIYNFYELPSFKVFDTPIIYVTNLNIGGANGNVILCNESTTIYLDPVPLKDMSRSLSNPGNKLSNFKAAIRSLSYDIIHLEAKQGITIGYLPVTTDGDLSVFSANIYTNTGFEIFAEIRATTQPTSITAANRGRVQVVYNFGEAHFAIGTTTTIENKQYQPLYVYFDSQAYINGLFLKPVMESYKGAICPFIDKFTTTQLTESNTIATDKENGKL